MKVTDFGIAKATGVDELTRTGMVMGTARYLAPEQVNGRTADARTDVYALGLLMYEMCCGHPPFGGDTEIATAMARLTTTPPPIRDERGDVPRALDDLVHRCLARDPAKRFASAAAVRHALDIVAGAVAPKTAGAAPRPSSGVAVAAPAASAATTSTTAARSRPVPTARRRRRRGSWLWLLLVFLVAAGAGVAAYLVVRNETNGGSGGGGGSANASSLPPASEASFAVFDFDPFDSETVKQENRNLVGLAHDGDTSTAWSTEGYDNFSEKPGVGLHLALDGEYALQSVSVSTTDSGWSAEIYVIDRDEAPTSLSEWGDPVTSGTDVDTPHTFSVDPAEPARAVLVWFTALPPPASGERQSLQVSEVELA